MVVQVPALSVDNPLPSHGENRIQDFFYSDLVHGLSPFDMLVGVTIVLLGWIVSRVIQTALTRAFLRRNAKDVGGEAVIKRLVHYAIMVVTVLVALNFAGFQLTSLFAAGAVFALVVGFALQNLSQNFVSGVILMVERSITPDDVLEVEGRVVKVVRMGIRATVARTRDDEDLIIPNSLLVTSTVKNFTLRDSFYRLRAHVGVSYSSDQRRVRSVLEHAARSIPWRSQDKDVRILLTDFGASSVNYEVSVWIEDPWLSRQRLSDLNESIWHALYEAGITIAYPQLDVHIDTTAVRALRGEG